MPMIPKMGGKYEEMFRDAIIYNEHLPEVNEICRIIRANGDRYRDVSLSTKVPATIIGAIHMRESSFNFNCHLYNGDPLSSRTVHVPAGKPEEDPADGGTTYSWIESAISAINDNLRGWNIDPDQEWGVAEALYFCEAYNGLAYRKHGINTPYLWSYTDKYSSGLFVEDGKFNANAISAECGCVPVFKMLGLHL